MRVIVKSFNRIVRRRTNSNGRTATRLIVVTTLPILFVSPRPVPIESNIVDDHDLPGLVL